MSRHAATLSKRLGELWGQEEEIVSREVNTETDRDSMPSFSASPNNNEAVMMD
ncbi:MAG: hypothetical protein LBU34_13640 [Planctomycetaceae bacterium]|nr:hypothetical protein [Planctomycetaceae bacterium]